MKEDLVERRQRYIQRQIALDKSAVNVQFRGQRPEGSGSANRHGMPKLPVGQHEVANWPVLDLGEQPDIDRRSWKLEVGGLVENPFTLTWDQFTALGRDVERSGLAHVVFASPWVPTLVGTDRYTDELW